MNVPRRSSTRRTKAAPPPSNGRGGGLRERLKRDRFLVILCLAALGFVTAVFALTWWVTGGVLALALALASLLPAFFLFYLRDA
jgi:Flp pilus assembly protein TadB